MAAALVRGAVQRKAEEHLQEAYLRAKEVGRYEPQPFNTPPFGWVTIPELMLSLRSSFREGARQTEEEIISRYSDVTLLVLDDLGAEKSSDFAIQSLYLIIDRRYSREQQTIITSNLSLGEIAEKIGDRIASRIAGMCKVVELKGKDRRLP